MTKENPALIRSRCGRDVYIVGSQKALEKVPQGKVWVTEAEVNATVPAVGELVLRLKEVFGSENVRVRFTGKAIEGKHYVKRGLDYELEEKKSPLCPCQGLRAKTTSN